MIGLGATAVLVALDEPVRVTPATLLASVQEEVGAASVAGECVRVDGPRWRCDVPDASGSAGVSYTIEVKGRCWQARRDADGPAYDMPRRAGGCVHR